jgi:hypothetical protein
VRALSTSNGDVHESAAGAFKKLLGHRKSTCHHLYLSADIFVQGVFRRIIEPEVPFLVKMLKKKEPYTIQTFLQLAQHSQRI